jgi:hypothetical protein
MLEQKVIVIKSSCREGESISRQEYLDYLNANHKDVMTQLAAGKYTDELTDVLGKVAVEIASKY